jgi:hypothetical protein
MRLAACLLLALGAIVTGSEIEPGAAISAPTHVAVCRKLPALSSRGSAFGSRRAARPSVLAVREIEVAVPRRQARVYQAILVAWLYNFGVAVSALQQQYIFNQLFSEDGSATPTPTSALLFGYKKACDYFFTFLTVGCCGALSDRVGRRPLMAYSAAGLATGFVMVATCHRRLPQQLLIAGCIDGVSSCMPNICQVGDGTRTLKHAAPARTLDCLLLGQSTAPVPPRLYAEIPPPHVCCRPTSPTSPPTRGRAPRTSPYCRAPP